MSNWFSAEMRATWIGPGFQNLYLEPADLEQINADASATVGLGWFGSFTVGGTLGGPRGDHCPPQANQSGFHRAHSATGEDAALQDALATRHDKLLRLGYTRQSHVARCSCRSTRRAPRGPALPITWEGFASLTVPLGWRTIASAVTSVDTEGEALTSVHLQRSLPLGPGFGFRIDADAQEPYRTQGTFEVQGRRGIIGVRADGSQDARRC